MTKTDAPPDEGNEDSSATDSKLKYDEESPNLVIDFEKTDEGTSALKTLAERVIRDHDEAFEATREYRDRTSKDWKIFSGDLPKKTYPYQDSANPHVPIMVENVTRNVFRAYAELFGDWDDVFGVVPIGPADEETANLLSLHGNWQIRAQIPDFARQQFRAMLAFFTHGDVTVHSYWDQEREQNRHQMLTPDDFVVPYVFTSTMPDYSDVPFYVKVMKLYRHEIESRDDWENVDEILGHDPEMDSEPEQPMSIEAARGQGVSVEESPKTAAPYKILWYEGWLRLPNQKRDRFCRAIVDYASRAVAQLLILEEPDWQDVQRYESQLQELQEYELSMQNYQQQVASLEQQVKQSEQMIEMGREQMGALQSIEMAHQLESVKAQVAQVQPPPPPTWMQNPDDPNETPEEPKRKPVYLFRHGVLIEPLVGNLGLGYGRSQADYNRAANTMLSQFIDAATLANIKSFLSSDLIEIPEKATIEPGKFTRIAGVTGDELKNNIMPLEFGPPAPSLMEGADKMREYASSEMQAPAVLSGDPGKSGETFRGIQARIEQATKQLSVGTRKFANEVLHGELVNNALLNSKFMKDEELFHIAASRGAIPSEMKIGRRMYERSYHIEIRADLRFASQSTRVSEADELLALTKQVPQLQQNIPFVYAAVKRCLLARDRADMVSFLGPAPPPPATTFGVPPPPPPQPPQPNPMMNGAPPGGPMPNGAPHPMGQMPPPAMARGV